MARAILILYQRNSQLIQSKTHPFFQHIDPIFFQIELIDLNRNLTVTQEQQTKPIEMYQLAISALKKHTNYSVKINCATKIGSGPWSSPIVYVQTLEDGRTH